MKSNRLFLLILGICLAGCSSIRERVAALRSAPTQHSDLSAESGTPEASEAAESYTAAKPEFESEGESFIEPEDQMVLPVDFEETTEETAVSSPEEVEDETVAPTSPQEGELKNEVETSAPSTLQLDAVVSSVYANFPLLEAARFQRNVANGEILSAEGAFDTKFKASTENLPLGYYENYRQVLLLTQPLYGGAEVYGGYRLGRGQFQPWYLERQTNEGGEFKTGVQVPLVRNRSIDERRAQLWKATYVRQRTEPEIQSQLIDFVRDGSLVYWDWVAAGRKQVVARRLLELAVDRNDGIRARVKAGDLDPPDAEDNQRIIVSREAKVIDAGRKVRQSAVKLSLFYRDDIGHPVIPLEQWTPDFPNPTEVREDQLASDITLALTRRPEIQTIDILRREIDVDYASAQNDYKPQVDALVFGSQDVGAPTSIKRDKSPFDLEAGIYADVPLQRRKARGKISSIEAKVSQIIAKRQMIEDKVTTEVQSAHAGLTAAWARVAKARESLRLARKMAQIELQKFNAGSSDLLSVNLREQQAFEAAETEIDALLEYFQSKAIYRAALAEDNDFRF